MRIQLRRADLRRRNASLIALVVPEVDRGAALDGPALAIDRATRGAISRVMAGGDFRGAPLEKALLYPPGLAAPRLLLVGLGPRRAVDAHGLRKAAATVAREAREIRAGRVALALPGEEVGLGPEEAARATAEGLVLGHYRYAPYRSGRPQPRIAAIDLVTSGPPARGVEGAVARGVSWAEAACIARDLANTPGQDLVPQHLAERAREVGRLAGARVQILGPPEMERLGMGALLAVGRGSAHSPRFVVLDRAPKGARVGTVVLVGKGVTFDTGGISLKPRENMHKMKYDMSGAAAVLGVFAALSDLDPPFRVIGLLALAENMPGGRAFKPGDVLRALDGTTIEVTNTDAEGRLVLADALGYARRFDPEVVVDLATLTGAVSVALGHLAAGLFTDDDVLAAELSGASDATAERLWRLPLWNDYAADLRSDVADLVNSSGAREGGAILGAVFLKRFARGMRWAHLDIASTAWSPADRPHEPRGATGFGVRLLLEWLSRRVSESRPPSSSPAARRARPGARSPRGSGGASSRRGSPRRRTLRRARSG